MSTTNSQLASMFQRMADVLQLLEADVFRVRAYQKIARVLGELSTDVAAIGPDLKALTGIEGIGKGSAERIAEFLTTGRMKDHDELLTKIPPGLIELLNINGLGPKGAAQLWKESGVDSLASLKSKLDSGALDGLKGWGPKKVENLKKNLTFAESAGGRVRIGTAMPVAAWFVERVKALPGVKQVQYAGSLRRGRETIGDIDIVCSATTEAAPAILDAFVKLEPVAAVVGHGPTKASVRTKPDLGQIQVDLRVVAPDQYGAALLYFTGSKEHNIVLRERAIKKDLRLNEYGLFDAKEKSVAGKSEEDVYRALGLDWIPPELREDHGEIDQAAKHALPELLDAGDIKAELHAHTTASDGLWSIRELVEAAISRGFHTIAVTDHSRSQPIANGLSPERLKQHIVEVRKIADEYRKKITVLAGSEVDILADGSLDYEDALLAELDIVVASPHAALSQEPAKATERLLRAIEHRYVTILGHPTGRLVNQREGLSPDMGRLIAAAAKRGIALEINANHYRLDLRDAHARAAIAAGAKLAINTDAHGPADLNELQYGVLTARRAGAGKADVVNCLGREKLGAWIKALRGERITDETPSPSESSSAPGTRERAGVRAWLSLHLQIRNRWHGNSHALTRLLRSHPLPGAAKTPLGEG